MRLTAYLFVSSVGGVRVTKTAVKPRPNEIGVTLKIEIPNKFYDRPNPSVNIQVPEEYLVNPNAQIVAHMVAPEIATALKLDVEKMEDGLLTMLKEQLPDAPAPDPLQVNSKSHTYMEGE